MTIGRGQLYRKKTDGEKHFTLSLAGEMGAPFRREEYIPLSQILDDSDPL
jgi:hypothetical protein